VKEKEKTNGWTTPCLCCHKINNARVRIKYGYNIQHGLYRLYIFTQINNTCIRHVNNTKLQAKWQ